MDQIFDRLGNLLKSFVREDSSSFSDSRSASFSDPDLQNAWDELDDFLKSDEETPRQKQQAKPASAIPETLRKDYKALGVDFGAPLNEVAKSYKLLLRTHHPDRHATDPAAYAKATEKTKGLTSAFGRIKRYTETGEVG